jgi:hypothetical protein
MSIYAEIEILFHSKITYFCVNKVGTAILEYTYSIAKA